MLTEKAQEPQMEQKTDRERERTREKTDAKQVSRSCNDRKKEECAAQ